MQYISFTDANDVMFNVQVGGKKIKIRMSWNPIGFWTLSMWTLNKSPIVNNIKVVPNIPLNMTKHCFDIPSGEFVVLSDTEELVRESFVEGRAFLCYLEKEEI